MRTTTKVKKWGNSLAVRLPSSFVSMSELDDGSPVTLLSSGKSIKITPERPTKQKSLQTLLSGVNPDMIGGEYDWGEERGRERWQ